MQKVEMYFDFCYHLIKGGDKMKCAYCGKETKGTKEHIISSAILDLFPECYITFDDTRKKIYQSDPMVKDVCAECNNRRISYIDSYAKKLSVNILHGNIQNKIMLKLNIIMP